MLLQWNLQCSLRVEEMFLIIFFFVLTSNQGIRALPKEAVFELLMSPVKPFLELLWVTVR